MNKSHSASGYVVAQEQKGQPTRFLSREPSTGQSSGAIGSGGSQWTTEVGPLNLFSSQDEARSFKDGSSESDLQVLPVRLNIEVQEPANA